MKLELSVRNASAVITNLRRLPDEAKAAVREVVHDNGELCRELTAFLAPRDTGFMAEHVTTIYSESGLVFETGWDVMDFVNEGKPFYPFFVEFGTETMAAQPSLTPAFEDVASHHMGDVAAAIEFALARSAHGRAVRPLRRAAARGR
jgi:HK97 gp10 family phage protein